MSAIPKYMPLRALQDAHLPDCMCPTCVEADACELCGEDLTHHDDIERGLCVACDPSVDFS